MCTRKIHAAFETVRRIRPEAQHARFAGNHVWLKESCFKQNVLRIIFNSAVRTAHDARKGERLLVISNDQKRIIEFAGFAIEQCEFFVRLSETNMDAAIDFGCIKRVHRLAQFHHHIVGHIHHRADRTHAAACKTPHHPRRCGRFGIDATHQTANI